MWNKGKALAVCLSAAAWWGVFYPELCFTEETCKAVQNGEWNEADAQVQTEEIWRAQSGEIVISSRFLEWCEEHLTSLKE